MNIVTSSTERMQNLIKAILEYSRIGRGKKLEKIDCNEVIENVITDLNYSIQESKGTVHTEQLPTIIGYKTELSLLIQNLVSNALKFKKESTPPIVKISSKTTPNGFHFCVEDNGIGMEEKYVTRIFQLFSRLHSTEKYEGTGIGLTHSKKIVELHGGKIWAESEINKGTTFHFIIPKQLTEKNNETKT